jgi:fluoride exporter
LRGAIATKQSSFLVLAKLDCFASLAMTDKIRSAFSRGGQVSYLIVFFGGGLGATLRHLINVICARCMAPGFPWGTFIINITGSTVMGLIAGYLAFRGEASQPWRLFLMTGVLGGYTTFSAYSLDAALLYERGELLLAALYVVGSVVLSIAGLFAGLALIRHFS